MFINVAAKKGVIFFVGGAVSVFAVYLGWLFFLQSSTGLVGMTKGYVDKYVLKNGLTVLVRKVTTVPKVAVELWYHVGSKDEQVGEKGLAHLIEHMIFKGTTKLSESDINTITHKLSGYCNAFTSFDYTGYTFDFPSQHYKVAFDIIADCMQNCTFDPQMLNSEMKAVIQELKMYRDNYGRDLAEKMMSRIFAGHPYHFPIIGFKRDLWTVTSDDLKRFYKKHYKPNNATLIVVGDVEPEEVFTLAKRTFESVPADPEYKKHSIPFEQGLDRVSVAMYRDVQIPIYCFGFTIPGLKEKKDYFIQLIEWIIANGRGSILYKKLVNELQFASEVNMFSWDLFDGGISFFACDPLEGVTQDEIATVIKQELELLAKTGVTDQQLTRAINKAKSAFYSSLESVDSQAYMIGSAFLATGDEQYLFNMMNVPFEKVKQEVNDLLKTVFRPTVMHEGAVLPLPSDNEKKVWKQLQESSDTEDNAILSARKRTAPLQDPVYANKITAKEPVDFAYKTPSTFTLNNGLKVLYTQNDQVPKIAIVVQFKAQYVYDPEDKEGLFNFVACMIPEGTKNYTAEQLAEFIEAKGMTLITNPGGIMLTVLKDDLKDGLSVIKELLQNVSFESAAIEKVRAQLLNDVKHFWDDPKSIAGQLLREIIYKGHPYQKNILGTVDSVSRITKTDLEHFYQTYVNPWGTTIAIVGDLTGYDVEQECNKLLSDWKAKPFKLLSYPELPKVEKQIKDYYINRDQVVLLYGMPSIDRKHHDYDKLLIFDQIFGGGFLGSMHSKLFQLREQTGLFYTINGTFLSGSDEQPGCFKVFTIVSLDRVKEAQESIESVIQHATDNVSDEAFEEAKRAIINASMHNFTSNVYMATAFLNIDKFGLPVTYYSDRKKHLENITKDQMIEAVKKIVAKDNFVLIRAGRV